jgi:hypothetical protein
LRFGTPGRLAGIELWISRNAPEPLKELGAQPFAARRGDGMERKKWEHVVLQPV